jgi:HEAT repeat protein
VRTLSATLLAAALLAPASASAFTWPNAAERIEEQLGKSDVGTRRRAAHRLAELPAGSAKRLVQKAMADSDAEVRLAAADLVLEHRIKGMGDVVLAWLNDPERRIRLSAAEILHFDPVKKAVAPLGRVLGDPDSAVRSAAAAALAASGSSDAVLPLLGHLDDSVPAVRSAIVKALARIRDKRAVVPLIGKIQDSRPAVRQAVARALGELGDARASSALVLALRDNDDSVRIAALEALGMLHDKQAVLAVSGLVGDDPRSPVRAAALEALARIGTPEALDALVASLASDDPNDTESSARRALAKGGEAAAKRLEHCLGGQPSRRLADGCALSLAEVGSPGAAKAVVEAQKRGVVSPGAALSALAEIADPNTLPTVLEHLSSSDPVVRRAAIDGTLALLDPENPDGRAVEPIAKALERARLSRAERAGLTRLLGRTGSPRAVPILSPLAEATENVELRIAAIEALGMIAPAGQDRVLLSALDADEGPVRLAAAVALRHSASGKAAKALLDRLERAAEQDRGAISIALGGALSRSKDAELLGRAERLMLASRGGQRDALIEAIARFPSKDAVARLAAHARRAGEIADRAKVAESLAGRADAREVLLLLAKDVDGSVRANAIWSLGSVGTSQDRGLLVAALDDRDVAVAGDAAAALGRLGARTKVPVAEVLCRRIGDTRSYVRANALAALRVAGKRCARGEERSVLVEDRSEVARRAAALLMVNVKSSDPARDRELLESCAAEDPDGSVAAACAQDPTKIAKTSEPVAIYVVPVGESAPLSRAPFALVRADGLMRLGVADRRGEIFERDAPSGEISLAVPAPLAR